MEVDLTKIPLFSGLRKAEIKPIADNAIIRSYPKNTIIIHEGDTSDSMYIILSGKVKVFVSNDNGREVILGVQGPGEYFGEISFIDTLWYIKEGIFRKQDGLISFDFVPVPIKKKLNYVS